MPLLFFLNNDYLPCAVIPVKMTVSGSLFNRVPIQAVRKPFKQCII